MNDTERGCLSEVGGIIIEIVVSVGLFCLFMSKAANFFRRFTDNALIATFLCIISWVIASILVMLGIAFYYNHRNRRK